MIPISSGNGGVSEKLVLKAEAMGFGDPWKGGWEPMGASGRTTVPEGLDWKQSGVYSQPPGAKKLIPVNKNKNVLVVFGGSHLVIQEPALIDMLGKPKYSQPFSYK